MSTDAEDPADDARNLWRRWSAKGLNGEANRIPLLYIEAQTVTDYILGHGKRPKSWMCYPSKEPAELAVVFCRPDANFSTPYSLHTTTEGAQQQEVRRKQLGRASVAKALERSRRASASPGKAPKRAKIAKQ